MELTGKKLQILMPEENAKHHDHYIQKYLKTNEERLMRQPRKLEAVTKNRFVWEREGKGEEKGMRRRERGKRREEKGREERREGKKGREGGERRGRRRGEGKNRKEKKEKKIKEKNKT